MKHDEHIEAFEMRLGVEGLKELMFCIQSGKNFHALASRFGVSLYDLRYLRTVSDLVSVRQFKRVPLRLVMAA